VKTGSGQSLQKKNWFSHPIPQVKNVNKNCLKQTEKRLNGGGNRASAMWPQMHENRLRGKAAPVEFV
jgi:hypothetical protein